MEEEKLDVKQWIPVYGIYRVLKAKSNGEHSLADRENHEGRFYLSAIYHGSILLGLVEGGIAKLVS